MYVLVIVTYTVQLLFFFLIFYFSVLQIAKVADDIDTLSDNKLGYFDPEVSMADYEIPSTV